MGRLKFSAMSVSYVQFSLDYTLESFKNLGFNSIEFWAGEPHYYAGQGLTKEDNLNRINDLKRKLNEYNMKVIMYTPETLGYPFSYSHPSEDVRNRTIEYMKRACDEASYLGCKQVFINSGCGLRDLPYEENWDRCKDSFIKITKYAETLGIDIVLEQLQAYESNLITTAQDCLKMVNEINMNNFKVCLDVVAMEVAGESIEEFFDLLGDRIAHIHLADNNHEILGTGTYDISSYLEYLESIDFSGYVSLEINDSIYWTNPENSIKESLDWLKSRGYIGGVL